MTHHSMLDDEAQRTVQLALGRILRMGARSSQPGDIAEYDRCRGSIMNILDASPGIADHAPNYARDHKKGAAGD